MVNACTYGASEGDAQTTQAGSHHLPTEYNPIETREQC
jgi:hypothetical protein